MPALLGMDCGADFAVILCRNDVVTIGQVPADLIREASDGKVNEPWPAQINKLVGLFWLLEVKRLSGVEW